MALTGRRSSDPVQKKQIQKLMESVATMVREQLTWKRALQDQGTNRFNYLCLMMTLVSVLILDDRQGLALQTPFVLSLAKVGTLDEIPKIFIQTWDSLKPFLDKEKAEANKDMVSRINTCLEVTLGVMEGLSSKKLVTESPYTHRFLTRADKDKSGESFDVNDHVVEMLFRFLSPIDHVWKDPFLGVYPGSVTRLVIGILLAMLKTDVESKEIASSLSALAANSTASSFIQNILGAAGPSRSVIADEVILQHLLDMGFPRSASETALIRSGNHLERATEYLILHPALVESSQRLEEETRRQDAAQPDAAAAAAAAATVPDAGSSSTAQPLEGPSSALTASVRAAFRIVGGDDNGDVEMTDAGNNDVDVEDLENDDDYEDIDDDEDDELFEAGEDDEAAMLAQALALSMGAPDAMVVDKLESKGKGKTKEAVESSKDALAEKRAQVERLKEAIKESFLAVCLSILDNSDDVIVNIKDLILFVGKDDVDKVIQRLVEDIRTIKAEGGEGVDTRIFRRLRLLAMVSNDPQFQAKSITAAHSFIFDLLRAIVDENISQVHPMPPWLSSALLMIESYISISDEPRLEKLEAEFEGYGFPTPKSPGDLPEPLSKEQRNGLLNQLIGLVKSDNLDKDLLHAVMRITVRLTRDHSLAVAFADSGALSALFHPDRIAVFSTQQQLSMMILRHVVEEPAVLLYAMEKEIREHATTLRGRGVDLQSFLRSRASLVCRDPATFVKATEKVYRLSKIETSGRLHQLIVKSDKSDSKAEGPDKDKDGVREGDKEKSMVPTPQTKDETEVAMAPVITPLEYSRKESEAVVQYIVGEILTLRSTQNVSTDSLMPFEESQADGTASLSADPKLVEAVSKTVEQKTHIRRCFLLQALTELISSYPSCRIALLNASNRKGKGTPHKPRSALIGHLLNDILPLAELPAVKPEAVLSKASDKHTESTWAVSLLAGLCVSDLTDETYFPELENVQKSTLECIAKAIKESAQFSETVDVKFCRYSALAELCLRILNASSVVAAPVGGIPNPSFPRPVAGANAAAEVAALAVSRIMVEKNFVGLITNILTEIDPDHPDSKIVYNALLKPLEQLSRLAIKIGRAVDAAKKDKGGKSSSEPNTPRPQYTAVLYDDSDEELSEITRHSALGVFNAHQEEDEDMSEDDESMDEDEEGYDDMDDDAISGDDGDEREDLEDSDTDEADDDMEIVVPSHYAPEMGREGGSEDDEDSMDDLDASDPDNDAEMMSYDEDDDEDGHPRLPDEHMNAGVDAGDPYDEDDDDEDDDEDEEEDPEHDDEEARLRMMAEDDSENEERDPDDSASDMDAAPEGGFDFGAFMDGDDEEFLMRDGQGHFMPPLPMGAGGMFPGRGRRHFARRRFDAETGAETIEVHVPMDDYPFEMPNAANPFSPFAGRATATNDENMVHPLLSANAGGAGNRIIARAELDPGRDRMAAAELPLHALDQILGRNGLQFLQNLISRGGRQGAVRLEAIVNASGAPGSSDSTDSQRLIVHSFVMLRNAERWNQESRLMYNSSSSDKALRVVPALLNVLAPPAVEEERKTKLEDEERKKKLEEQLQSQLLEEKVSKEEESRKLKEELEKSKLEMEEDARLKNLEDVGAVVAEASPVETAAMETDVVPEPPSNETPASAPEKVTILIHGSEVDITGASTNILTIFSHTHCKSLGTGIDPTFLEALPDEIRQEVISQHFREQRRSQRVGGDTAPISSEFMEALPAEIRAELEAQERAEQQRRVRAEELGSGPVDLDPASFIATLDPLLRQAILMEGDEGLLSTLPPGIVAEANVLRNRQMHRANTARRALPSGLSVAIEQEKKSAPRAEAVQLVERGSLSALLKLLFTPEATTKNMVLRLLVNLSENSKTRSELITMLLSILAEGEDRLGASGKGKERARRKSTVGATFQTESIPNFVTQCALEALVFMVDYNNQIINFMLTESESFAHNFSKSTKSAIRRSKSKEKAHGGTKYPIVICLSLLEKSEFLENSSLMELLMRLLATTLRPLSKLGEKSTKPKTVEQARPPAPPDNSAEEEVGATLVAISASNPVAAPAIAVASSAAPVQTTDISNQADSSSAIPTEDSKLDKQPDVELKPPQIPDHCLRSVVKVLTTGDCSNRTFQYALSVMQHLSTLKGAREVVTSELTGEAQILADALVLPLDELSTILKKAENPVDIPGRTLEEFSPSSSQQAKLLRVLKTVDFIHSKKISTKPAAIDASAASLAEGAPSSTEKKKDDTILSDVYDKLNLAKLWTRLGTCMAALSQKIEMIHIATVLLPLIEAFMVVSKPYITQKPAHLRQMVVAKKPSIEMSTEEFFLTFTEEHRKILNTMVRNTPTLMSGSF